MSSEYKRFHVNNSRVIRLYKSVQVGEYIPDLIAFDQIIVETKTVERITDIERGQVINYFKITGLRVGIILNFKQAKLEGERIVP